MKTKRLKKYSLFNLMAGYLLSAIFIVLILFNVKKEDHIKLGDNPTPNQTTLITELKEDLPTEIRVAPLHQRIVHATPPIVHQGKLVEEEIYNERVFYKDSDSPVVVHSNHRDVFTRDAGSHSVDPTVFSDGFNTKPRGVRTKRHHDNSIDFGLLDRRLVELDTLDAYGKPRTEHKQKDKEKVGLHTKDRGVDFSRLSPSNGDDLELGELNSLTDNPPNSTKGYGIGKGGQLYAYNFPTRGVGAGIGSSALGAGAGGGAGLGAGIGEGVLNGEIVPTLGGIGDGAKTLYGEPAQAAGVGGLVGGAGAGGAAGITQG